MDTKIILVRHGETAWNAEDRVQGHHDVPLSSAGIEQARQLNPRLKALPIAAAYSSDMKRSLETARIALDSVRLEIQTRTSLRERNFGKWEGKAWSEILRDFPEEAGRFLKDPVGFTPPEGEPWLTMQERAYKEALEIARENHGQSVLVFTHGGPAKAIVLKALGLPPALWRKLSTDNASLSTLELTDSAWRLINLNVTYRLNGVSSQEPIG